jgi:membrane protease YdiL (CAAX protease family)
MRGEAGQEGAAPFSRPLVNASATAAYSPPDFADGWLARKHSPMYPRRVVPLPDISRRRLFEVCLIFSTFLFPSYFASSGSGVATVTAGLPTVLLIGIPQTAFVLYLLWIQGEQGRPELGFRRVRRWDFAAGAMVLSALLLLQLVSRGVVELLPEAARRAADAGVRFRLSGWSEIPAALVFCGVAAAREELLYRAYLYVRLADIGLPPAVAVGACAALFAAAHAYQGYLAVALALLQGILLAGAFVRTRSIAVPIAGHACYNLIVLLLTLAPGVPVPA